MCSTERKVGMIYISKTETTHAGITSAGARGGQMGQMSRAPRFLIIILIP
jgi:hypothetical protein